LKGLTVKQANATPDFLLRRTEVERIAGISSASIYRLMKSGKFPHPVSLGTGSVRWKQSDVVAWQSSLIKTA
jgi:prophage regulatory protein